MSAAAAAAADERKTLIKTLKRDRMHLTRALDNMIATHVALKELGEEPAAAAAPKAKAKSAPKKAKAVEAEPKAKAAPPAGEPEAPFVCAGNVLNGDACPNGSEPQDASLRAADTRHEKHNHPTCKTCKKLISKARAASRQPAAAAEAVADAE